MIRYKVASVTLNPHTYDVPTLDLISDDGRGRFIRLTSAELPWFGAQVGDVFLMPETKEEAMSKKTFDPTKLPLLLHDIEVLLPEAQAVIADIVALFAAPKIALSLPTAEYVGQLKALGCSDDDCAKVLALPGINLANLIAFLKQYGPAMLSLLLALFGQAP